MNDETLSGVIRGAAGNKSPVPCVWQWVPGLPCGHAVMALQILTMQINERWSMPNHTVNQDLLCRRSFQTPLNLLQALASVASQTLCPIIPKFKQTHGARPGGRPRGSLSTTAAALA